MKSARSSLLALAAGFGLMLTPLPSQAQETFWSGKGAATDGGGIATSPGLGTQTAEVPTVQLSQSANQGLTAQAMGDIVRNAQPALKDLSRLPSNVSLQSLPTTTGGTSGAVTVKAGSLASLSAGTVDREALVKSLQSSGKSAASAANIKPDNYGSLYGYNSIYHYNDKLVSGYSYWDYPQGAIGVFYFTFDNSNWFYCTATLIGPSILVTAGHCVHQGNNSNAGWLKQGYFYPNCAYCSGGGTLWAPFGYAYAASASTTGGWYTNGGLDQGYDVAAVALYKKQGSSIEIGSQTGWLSFCTGNCLQPYWALTQYGYPSNYYSGAWMFEGQHLEAADGRDYVLGSGARGGSSGGPHIANPGWMSDSSSSAGQWPYRNVIFAVTSWGYVGETQKIQGASPLTGAWTSSDTNNFRGIYNSQCNVARSLHGTGSCSTY